MAPANFQSFESWGALKRQASFDIDNLMKHTNNEASSDNTSIESFFFLLSNDSKQINTKTTSNPLQMIETTVKHPRLQIWYLGTSFSTEFPWDVSVN
jgi:hypothetical protein